MFANCSVPAPRTIPATSRPFEIMSTMASDSATASGLSIVGSGEPSSTIFTRCVAVARMLAQTVICACMQKGASWCSLSMMPSKPTSSASWYSSRRSL